MECYLIQPSRGGRAKFLHLVVEGDQMTTTWGLVGGATQTTTKSYDYINQGKSNELTPEQAAVQDFERKRDKKIKEGYRQADSLEKSEEASLDTINFDDPPTSFAPSKPIKDISDAFLMKLKAEGRLNLQLKLNGMCHFIFIGSTGKVRIFTRRMDDHTRKYPTIATYVESLVHQKVLPKKSVLITEFVADPDLDLPHMLAFKRLQEISKSDTNKGQLKASQAKALKLQIATPIRACVFHIPYFAGEELWHSPYGDVYDLIKEVIPELIQNAPLFVPTNLLALHDLTVDGLKQLARKDDRIEGFVAWDNLAEIDVHFSGKPVRRAAYKVKFPKEMDVIAYDFAWGTGAREGLIGSLLIGKYDAELKNIIPFGNVGSGLKDYELDPATWEFPLVIQIEYAERYENGYFQFPVFIKKHEDKVPTDVVIDSRTGM